MGTTSEKLQYLATTKTLLKNKINLTGANITTDTFRQYPTKLQNALLECWNNEGEPIFTNWGTKVNGEGTNVKLDNTLNARMKITPKGNTTQDTNAPLPSGYTRYTSVQDTNGTIYTATSTQIPAKRNSDNVFGLYNINSKTFTTEV